MNHTPDQRPRHDDVISLVDLAATFIRRRKIFYAVFVVITLGGLAYALLVSGTYRYISLLQVAEKGAGTYIEEPAATIATLENRWLPEQEALFRAEANYKLPFGVSFSNPDETGLIRFESEATSDNSSAVERVHQNLTDKVLKRQSALLANEKRNLQSRLESVEQAIETLQGGEDTGAAIAEAFERKVRLEGDLEALKDAELLVISRQSVDTTGPARALIVVLAAVLGGGLGIFVVFFMQFVALVRSELTDEASG